MKRKGILVLAAALVLYSLYNAFVVDRASSAATRGLNILGERNEKLNSAVCQNPSSRECIDLLSE